MGNATTHTVQVTIDGAVVWASATRVREPLPDATIVESASLAAQHFASIAEYPQEVFAVAYLDGANQVQEVRWITVGLLDQNQVHPREVFAPAFELRSAAIIVAHNHPSGKLVASPEDIAITKRLATAGTLLGFRVLDHLIMAPNGTHLSMKSEGHL